MRRNSPGNSSASPILRPFCLPTTTVTDSPDQLQLAPIADAAATGRSSPMPVDPAEAAPELLTPPAPTVVARFDLREWLIGLFSAAFRAIVIRTAVWQWADSRGIKTEHGGVYLSRRRPWFRRLQACFTDGITREQYVIKASRSGATEAVLNRIRHMACLDPGNVQLCVGSQRISTEVNKGRLIPSLEQLGVFAEAAVDPEKDITSALLRIGAMTVRISGAYTEGAFRTHAIRFMVLDECDLEAIHQINGNNLFDLARSRIRGIDGAHMVCISKPTTWGSPFHREVCAGTMEFQLVPCPHCGAFQELTIDGTCLVDQLRIEESDRVGQPPLNPPLAHPTPSGPQPLVRPALGRLDYSACRHLDGSWDYDRIVEETRYRCVSGCLIHQDAPLTTADLERPHSSLALCPEVVALHRAGTRLTHKEAMLLAARHLAANPRPRPAIGGGRRSRRSEHVTDLISLDADMTWGHLALAHLSSLGDAVAHGTVRNEHLGLPRRGTSATVDPAAIAELRAPYARGTLPFVPTQVFLTVDTQDAFFKAAVLAARMDTTGQHWRDLAVVDYDVCPLNSDVIALLDRAFPLAALASGNLLPGAAPLIAADFAATFTAAGRGGIVDARGHRQDMVYQLYFESGRRLWPSRGESSKSSEMRPTWIKPISTPTTEPFNVIHHYAHLWKHRLYLGCIGKIREIKECTLRDGLDPAARDLPVRLWLPASPADARRAEFEAELQREHLTPDEKWEHTGPHDYADCIRLGLVWLDITRPQFAKK